VPADAEVHEMLLSSAPPGCALGTVVLTSYARGSRDCWGLIVQTGIGLPPLYDISGSSEAGVYFFVARHVSPNQCDTTTLKTVSAWSPDGFPAA
jgi:hypothetical protein